MRELLQFTMPGRPVSQPRPRFHGHVHNSDAYSEYRNEMAVHAQVAALELHERGTPWPADRQSYRVRIKFYMPDRRRSDIDKLEGTVLDALTDAGIYKDDRLVDSVRKDRDIDKDNPRVEVCVEVLG